MIFKKLRIALQLLVSGFVFLISLGTAYHFAETAILGIGKVFAGAMPRQELLVYALTILAFLILAGISWAAFLLLRLSIRQWRNEPSPQPPEEKPQP